MLKQIAAVFVKVREELLYPHSTGEGGFVVRSHDRLVQTGNCQLMGKLN